MAQRRRVTAKFKPPMVLDLVTGRKPMAQLCREPNLKEQVVMRWRAGFLPRAALLFRAEPERDEHRERMAELEGVVGRLTLGLDLATKASLRWGSRATRSGS